MDIELTGIKHLIIIAVGIGITLFYLLYAAAAHGKWLELFYTEQQFSLSGNSRIKLILPFVFISIIFAAYGAASTLLFWLPDDSMHELNTLLKGFLTILITSTMYQISKVLISKNRLEAKNTVHCIIEEVLFDAYQCPDASIRVRIINAAIKNLEEKRKLLGSDAIPQRAHDCEIDSPNRIKGREYAFAIQQLEILKKHDQKQISATTQ